ncbi:hypothetical protein Tco_1149401 [Tanacetum coccineum]
MTFRLRLNTFVDFRTELVEGTEMKESSKKAEVMEELAQESSSKRAGDELEQENAKKQKVDVEEETGQEKVKLQSLMKIVFDEEGVTIDAIPLATKPPSIVDWKIVKEGEKSYYLIIRAGGLSKRPEEGYERVLWGDLKTMFEPNVEDEVWKMQQVYMVVSWKLFDSCGVHCLTLQSGMIYLLTEKRYPLTPATITEMLNRKLQADY